MSKNTFLVMAPGLWEGAWLAMALTGATMRLQAARWTAGLQCLEAHRNTLLPCICPQEVQTSQQQQRQRQQMRSEMQHNTVGTTLPRCAGRETLLSMWFVLVVLVN